MLQLLTRKEFHRRGHHEHSQIAVEIGEVVEGVVVIGQFAALEIHGGNADFGAGPGVAEDEQVGDDGRVEKGIKPLVGHDVGAELGVGVVLEKLAARGGVIKLRAGDEAEGDVRAFADDAAVFGRGNELREAHTDMAAEVEAIQLARGRQEAGVENGGGRFARLGQGPDGVGELVVPVVGILFGEKKLHGARSAVQAGTVSAGADWGRDGGVLLTDLRRSRSRQPVRTS